MPKTFAVLNLTKNISYSVLILKLLLMTSRLINIIVVAVVLIVVIQYLRHSFNFCIRSVSYLPVCQKSCINFPKQNSFFNSCHIANVFSVLLVLRVIFRDILISLSYIKLKYQTLTFHKFNGKKECKKNATESFFFFKQ